MMVIFYARNRYLISHRALLRRSMEEQLDHERRRDHQRRHLQRYLPREQKMWIGRNAVVQWWALHRRMAQRSAAWKWTLDQHKRRKLQRRLEEWQTWRNWSVCDHFIFPSYENSFLFIAQILFRLLGQLIFLSYYSVVINIWASDNLIW